MIEYILATSELEYSEAANLFREYADEIKIDLSFQRFEEELITLQNMYSFPRGGIVLCRQDVRFVGCIAIRKIDGETCELKRMYVQPGFRKLGVGKNLLQEAISLANKLHYKRIKLDTLDTMHNAIKLYAENAFVQTAPYYNNPNKGALFFEKEL